MSYDGKLRPIMPGEDDMMTQLFPSSTTSSSHSGTMYTSTISHNASHLPVVSAPASAHYYSSGHMAAPYSQNPYWAPMPQAPSHPPFSYQQYPLSAASMAPSQMMNSTSHYMDQSNYLSRSSSTSSQSTYPLATADEFSTSNYARSVSPGSPDLRAYGYQNKNGTWTCAYPGCTSKAVFTRGCDLRKHHKRHTKSYFCSYENCPQSTGGGFSSKKDLARHMASHQPSIVCEWEGCDRVFSRVDNMRDHVKRIHMKGSRSDNKKRGVSQ